MLDSPLHAIARYEEDLGVPVGFINGVVVETGPSGAWSRLERGEVGMARFQADFEAECSAAGHAISGVELMARIATCGPRPAMLEAIDRIRARRLGVAALTNNWSPGAEASSGTGPSSESPAPDPVRQRFDVFIESSVVGLRKPDPRIYEHCCAELGVAPDESIFLDDIGRNLKAARALGMTTLKVDAPEPALDALAELLGFDLR